MNGAIQKVDRTALTLDGSNAALWTEERIALIKRQVAPKGCTDDDFAVFLAKCQRTGMDPLTGEALLVPRRNNIGTKETPKWVTLHVFQTTADGMRARAARFPDFLTVDSAAVHANDAAADVNTGTGEVNHRFNAAKSRGQLMGAWGRVTKRDGSRVAVWLPVGSRDASGAFWAKDPGGMLAKCAEVAALRKAYPVHFEHVYAREEMPPAEAQPSREQEVMQTLKRAEDGAMATPSDTPALPPPGLVVEFGEFKGRPAEALTLVELDSALADGRQKLASADAKARWKPTLEKNLAALSDLRAKMTPNNGPEDAQVDQPPPAGEPPEDMLLPGQNGYRQPGEEG